jgi:hypothetical protein
MERPLGGESKFKERGRNADMEVVQTVTIPSILIVTLSMAAVVAFGLGFWIGRLFLDNSNIGEALVVDAITSRLTRPHVLLNNVTLENGGGTTQIDHILVADTGIFVIETKHHTGWIFGSPNDRHWTKVIYRKRFKFQNPIRQNYGHLKAVQSLFTLPDDNFIPLVVFTGQAEFKTDVGPGVVKLFDLVRNLNSERPVMFDGKKMAYIVGRIEMKRLRRSIETDEYHMNFVQRRIQGRVAARV